MIVSSSDVDASHAAHFGKNRFFSTINHWCAIDCMQLKEVFNKQYVDGPKPFTAFKHLFQEQVYLNNVLAGEHGHFINDYQLDVVEDGSQLFLWVLWQGPIHCSFGIMFNWQLKQAMNCDTSHIERS